MRVAIDAMGGDWAPGEIVRGAVLAAREGTARELLLVGDENRIREEMRSVGYEGEGMRVVPASQVVDMGELPVKALRSKPDSSVLKAVQLAASGDADAVMSAGNTGAFVAAATLSMKLLPGVHRAGIAVSFPTYHRTCTLIDVGANVNCRAEHLLQYGLMASEFAKCMLGIKEPQVGLLNIGEEGTKGNELVKKAHKLLAESPLNFIGNIEGREVFSGGCDVAVCEGFVGNVVLKVSEGLLEGLYRVVEEAVANLAERGNDEEELLGMLRKRTNYAEFGGALLLGVDGICIICHGRSDAAAVRTAISRAVAFAREQVNRKMVPALSVV